jgi:hypothetical protein
MAEQASHVQRTDDDIGVTVRDAHIDQDTTDFFLLAATRN